MRDLYFQIFHDEKCLRVVFSGRQLPHGLEAFGAFTRDRSKVVVICPGGDGSGYDLTPARVACDFARDAGYTNLIPAGCSGKGITYGF